MYCPKCATHNNDDTKYCRSCGTNLAVVSKALTGTIPQEPDDARRKDLRKLQGGITQAFMGVGFLLVAFFLLITRFRWGVWMLIPAFIMMGRGVSQIMLSKYKLASGFESREIPRGQAPNTGELAARTADALPPVSVTEQTTQLLETERKQNTE